MDQVFLTVALFIPGITLCVAYITGDVPLNEVPFWGDLVLAIVSPRLLIILYIYHNLGVGVWFWVHVAAWVIVNSVSFRGEKESKRA